MELNIKQWLKDSNNIHVLHQRICCTKEKKHWGRFAGPLFLLSYFKMVSYS